MNSVRPLELTVRWYHPDQIVITDAVWMGGSPGTAKLHLKELPKADEIWGEVSIDGGETWGSWEDFEAGEANGVAVCVFMLPDSTPESTPEVTPAPSQTAEVLPSPDSSETAQQPEPSAVPAAVVSIPSPPPAERSAPAESSPAQSPAETSPTQNPAETAAPVPAEPSPLLEDESARETSPVPAMQSLLAVGGLGACGLTGCALTGGFRPRKKK